MWFVQSFCQKCLTLHLSVYTIVWTSLFASDKIPMVAISAKMTFITEIGILFSDSELCAQTFDSRLQKVSRARVCCISFTLLTQWWNFSDVAWVKQFSTRSPAQDPRLSTDPNFRIVSSGFLCVVFDQECFCGASLCIIIKAGGQIEFTFIRISLSLWLCAHHQNVRRIRWARARQKISVTQQTSESRKSFHPAQCGRIGWESSHRVCIPPCRCLCRYLEPIFGLKEQFEAFVENRREQFWRKPTESILEPHILLPFVPCMLGKNLLLLRWTLEFSEALSCCRVIYLCQCLKVRFLAQNTAVIHTNRLFSWVLIEQGTS